MCKPFRSAFVAHVDDAAAAPARPAATATVASLRPWRSENSAR